MVNIKEREDWVEIRLKLEADLYDYTKRRCKIIRSSETQITISNWVLGVTYDIDTLDIFVSGKCSRHASKLVSIDEIYKIRTIIDTWVGKYFPEILE